MPNCQYWYCKRRWMRQFCTGEKELIKLGLGNELWAIRNSFMGLALIEQPLLKILAVVDMTASTFSAVSGKAK